MRVLLIPEDFRNDQFILRPLFQRLFRSLDRRAAVAVCMDPLLGGVSEALKCERLAEIVEQYDGMTDLFILCVDRDGDTNRRGSLDRIEQEFGDTRIFLAENAWEELETWVLAGLTLPNDWRWADIRGEISVKEVYFAVLAEYRGVADAPGRGRGPLGEAASRNLNAIQQKCPEDFGCLVQRIRDIVTSGHG